MNTTTMLTTTFSIVFFCSLICCVVMSISAQQEYSMQQGDIVHFKTMFPIDDSERMSIGTEGGGEWDLKKLVVRLVMVFSLVFRLGYICFCCKKQNEGNEALVYPV